eukprot:4125092-Pyramimonas_sp.AAC.1
MGASNARATLRCRAAARSKDIKRLSSIIHFRRCPCLCFGRRPLCALLVNGLIDLRLQVAQGEVLIGSGRVGPEERIPAMPGIQSVIRQRLDRESERLLVDGMADALGIL